jgi:transcriptional regulator with XRE-family HTH domain
VGVVNSRDDVRDFLVSRRARITPQQAGLPVFGRNRRVAGLRREEVAMLAGVSVDYYTRLERGNLGGVSESVLDALAAALQLDDAERAHLFDLARSANAAQAWKRRRPAQQQVRPTVQRVLEAITGAPAFVRNSRTDILAANPLGRALYAPLYDDPVRPVNSARFVFLDPRAPGYYGDWERTAAEIVATLRTEAGRNPYDRALTDLVGELSTRSDIFRVRWAAHDVRQHHSGVKHLRHPVVGELHLAYESMELPADPGLSIVTFTAEVGSASQDGLELLASWAATTDRQDSAHTDHG